MDYLPNTKIIFQLERELPEMSALQQQTTLHYVKQTFQLYDIIWFYYNTKRCSSFIVCCTIDTSILH